MLQRKGLERPPGHQRARLSVVEEPHPPVAESHPTAATS
jgi:hypothetical protein